MARLCVREFFQVTSISCINFMHLNLQFSLRLYSCLRVFQFFESSFDIKVVPQSLDYSRTSISKGSLSIVKSEKVNFIA